MRHTPTYLLTDPEEVKRFTAVTRGRRSSAPPEPAWSPPTTPNPLDEDATATALIVLSHFGRPDDKPHELGRAPSAGDHPGDREAAECRTQPRSSAATGATVADAEPLLADAPRTRCSSGRRRFRRRCPAFDHAGRPWLSGFPPSGMVGC